MFIIVKKSTLPMIFLILIVFAFKSSDCLCTKLLYEKSFFHLTFKSFEVTNISFENEYINLKKIFSNY